MDICKSDLLLINAFSWTTERRACYLPYGVLYLAGFLRQEGLKVDIYDRNTDYSLDTKRCIAYFEKRKPAIVGISVLTGPVIADALKISRQIKSISPGTRIVWGGLHPTIFPEYVFNEESVDFIIQGEGELAMLELCRALLDKRPYSGIKNLGYRDNGRIILNPIREELLGLDSVDMPAWDLVDIKHYIANRFFASRVLTMNTSRGCPFRCTFCFNQGLPYQRWRGLNAENMYKQLTYLRDNYGINGIQFYEDSFDTDRNRVKEFCQLMIKNKIKVNWSHFSNVTYCNEELLRIEKAANCRYIEYGVESGSDRILKLINKKQTVEQIKDAFALCRRVGLKSAALFMIGYPSETMKELKETVDLVESLPAHILICTVYRPYPGTPLYDYCVENKKFKVPDTLQEQGDFYRLGRMEEDNYNLSDVPTKYLLKLQENFYAKFTIREAFLCLREFNFGLLIYYFKQQLNPAALQYTVKSLFTRIGLVLSNLLEKAYSRL